MTATAAIAGVRWKGTGELSLQSEPGYQLPPDKPLVRPEPPRWPEPGEMVVVRTELKGRGIFTRPMEVSEIYHARDGHNAVAARVLHWDFNRSVILDFGWGSEYGQWRLADDPLAQPQLSDLDVQLISVRCASHNSKKEFAGDADSYPVPKCVVCNAWPCSKNTDCPDYEKLAWPARTTAPSQWED